VHGSVILVAVLEITVLGNEELHGHLQKCRIGMLAGSANLAVINRSSVPSI
jgi:hypothetical protein